MKKINQPLMILSVLMILGLCSCQPVSNDQSIDYINSTFAEIPELLDRAPKIRNGKEWETVQNQYVRYRNEVISGQTTDESKLNLAHIFINEARITGEHGHYYSGALRLLDEVSESNDRNPDLQFRMLSAKAGVLLSLHQFEKARRVGEEAIVLNPHNARIYGVMVDACVEMGEYKTAVELADKMVAIRPDLRSYSRISYLREIHGDPEGAMRAMEMAVQSGTPGSEELAWAILTLGNLYNEYGQFEKAESAFKTALTVRPHYPFASAALANMEMEKENYEKAEEMLYEAITAIPEVGFYVQLVELYNLTDRRAAAEKTIKEILAMLKDDTEHGHIMNLEYAEVYADYIQDYERALEYALKEYKTRPENIDVNRALAEIYLKKGAVASAKKHFERAAVTNSRKPELLALAKEIN